MTGRTDHVVVVTFTVRDGHREAFLEAVVENANLSRTLEPGCRAFDVCADAEGGEVFLYEVYDDEAAFRDHLARDHFLAFDRVVASWVAAKRVTTYRRLPGAG